MRSDVPARIELENWQGFIVSPQRSFAGVADRGVFFHASFGHGSAPEPAVKGVWFMPVRLGFDFGF